MPNGKKSSPETALPSPDGGGAKAATPIRSDIGLVRAETVRQVDEVVFSAWKGVRKYQIIRAPRETVDGWKRRVDEFREAIVARDFPLMGELIQGGENRRGDPETIKKLVLEEPLDGTDITLLAIGLFVVREKSPWDLRRATLKVLLGGRIRMESALGPKGRANCYDIAAMVRELAARYGIAGELRGRGLAHAHFETAGGKVSDPMVGWKRGGLFQTKEAFEAYKLKLGRR